MLKRGRSWGHPFFGLLLSLCLFSVSLVQASEPLFTDIEDADEWYSETNQASQPDFFVDDELIEDTQEMSGSEPAGESILEGTGAFEGEALSLGEEEALPVGDLGGDDLEAFQEGFQEGSQEESREAPFTDGFSEGSLEEPNASLFSDGEKPLAASPFKGLRAYEPDPLPEAAGASLPDAGVGLGPFFDGRSYVTPVKNQNPFGSCWAFALTGAMEACLSRLGMGLYDLSEDHLAYFFSHRENDPLGNTPGDYNRPLLTGDFSYLQGAQSRACVSLFLSTWSGMADSALVPYPTDETHQEMLPTRATKEMAYETTAFLQDAVFCSQDQVVRYKELISKYGSLSVSLYMEEDYYQKENSAYSYGAKGKVNHSVLLVGWDDSYPRERFESACQVTSDGAFLAKNSWGPDWGEGGYFYISYEAALTGGIALSGSTCPAYPNNYFYDGASGLVWTTLSGGETLANVFQVKASPGECEALGEIVVADYSDDSSYQVQIYTCLEDAARPTSGRPAFEGGLSFHKEMAGVGTFSLPREVILLPGTYYSVVIQNAGDSPIHYLVDQSFKDQENEYVTLCGENQSFWQDSANGQWLDLSKEALPLCARLKAHTRTMKRGGRVSASLPKESILVGEEIHLVVENLPWENQEEGGPDPWSTLALSTGDEGVATISSQGVVRGVRAGFTYVSLSLVETGETLALPLRVEPIPAPENLAVTPKSYNRVLLTWEEVEGASGYVIFRGEEEGELLELARCEEASFTDGEVLLGVNYTYQVAAYTESEEGYCRGEGSSPVCGKAKSLDAPSYLDLSLREEGAELTWEKVSGAQGYRIFRKVEGGSFKKLATLTKGSLTSYVDTSVVSGQKYVYRVKAYRTVNKVRYFGYGRTSLSITIRKP